MALEADHFCPACQEEHSFWRTASTTLHLGTKTKWVGDDCEHRIVLIDGAIDTAD